MIPHFAGKSPMPVGLETRMVRDTHTPLDGTFLGSANPPAGAMTAATIPSPSTAPTPARWSTLTLPARAVARSPPSRSR